MAVLSLAVTASTAAAAKHHAKARHHAARRSSHRSHRATRRSHSVVVVRHAAETAPETEPTNSVESFEGGVLKIKLAGGETVTGKVGANTHLLCATPSTEKPGEDQSPGDDEGQAGGHEGEPAGEEDKQEGEAEGTPQGHGDSARIRPADVQSGEGEAGKGDEGDDQGEGSVQPCETSSLTAGAKVLYAQLEVGPSGAEWAVVVLSA